MNQETSKMWVWILAIALVVVGGLYIYELQKPDNAEQFSGELSELRANLTVACKDTETESGRRDCSETLQKIQSLVSEFFPQE